MSYYLSCSSPTGNGSVSCGSGRVQKYLGVGTNNNLALVNTKSTIFTFEYNNSYWMISTIINGVKYYVVNRSSGLQLSTSQQGGNWLLQIGSTNNTVRNITVIDSSIESVFIATPISNSDTGYWILTYSKEIFGDYRNNNMPMLDQILRGNPITTRDSQNRSVVCNYTWSFEQ